MRREVAGWQLLASADGNDRTVRVCDLATGTSIVTIPVHHSALAVASAHGRLAVGISVGILMVEIVTRYSNTPDLLSDLRRTVDAVTTMVIEDDEPDIAASAPVDRVWRVIVMNRAERRIGMPIHVIGNSYRYAHIIFSSSVGWLS